MLVVPSPKSQSTEVIGPSEVLLKFTMRGALPDSTLTENEAVGGTCVGVGIGVAVGLAVGALVGIGTGGVAVGGGVDVGGSVRDADGFGAGVLVAVGASVVAVATGVSGESEGIMKSHAGRTARVNVRYVRNMNDLFFTLVAPGNFSTN